MHLQKNLRERSTTEVGSELKEGFEKMDMKRRLTALRKVIPKMSAVEHYLEELQQQLRSSDAYDRAKILDIVDQLEKEIDIIEREAASYVDCRYYRESLRSCTAKLHGEGTSSTKGNLEPPVDKQYVKEVISRAELILERRETNEDEVRASLNDMEDCNVILRDWSSKRLDELRTRWEAKQREFEEWQQSMDRIRKIGDHLKTSKTVESSTLAELRRIEETCGRMHLTGLEPSLRLSLRRLRVMVETVLEERLDLLRMSGEDDCAVAHTIVQEVGEELVTFCPQLDERHTEARRILRDKMELFRRLQNYYDAMKYLRNRNIAWNTITVAEIPAVSAELETLVERCVSEWENDASRLRADLLAISGSFFQLELNLLTFEKEKLRDLMRVRLEYLDAARDFITSTDSSIDVTQMATPSDRHPDVENLTKDLCKNLEEKAGHLRELQDQAEMKISDLTISQRLKKFRQQIVGVADEDAFENAVRRFESLIANELPAADDPLQFLSIILQLKKSEESESKAFEDVNVLASSNHENAEKERITALYNSRQEQRKRLTLAYMYSYHDYLNALFRHHEEKAVQLINNRALRELQTFNDREWKQWKEAVGELESVLDASMRLRFRPEFADLQRKAFSLDSKIARSIASSAKYRRHEEKLALKLTQFEAWLNAMEDDMATVESMPPGDEQTARLAQLLSSCLSHQRLVGKLERLNIQNRSHVEQLCQKYYALISRLRRYDIEEGSLPLHVRTLVQAAPTQSQLSISSFGSSEVVDRPESVLSASSSVDVGVSSAESEGPLEKSIGEIRRRLHVIIQSYNDGPKPLPAATSDYNLLLNYLEDINDLFLELPRVDDAKKGALENSLLHLQEHFNEIKSQMQQEIEEEISISEKEKEILFELSKLEQRVKSREVLDHNIIYDLDQLQTQMDLLRMIRSQPRRFVESDLIEREGSPSAKTRHKRKVLVMVTNTVTTIIQVVEEHLLTIEAFSRDPVLEEKLALVKTNLRKLEEEVSTSPPELPLDTSAAEQSHTPYLETRTPAEMMLKDVPKNEAFAAAVVGIEQALNLAEDVNLENCNDPHVLSESLNLLERQQTSMDALSDIAEELSKEGFVEYIDTISLLQERLNSMKVSLTDRLSTLSTQASTTNEPIETVYSREESTSAGDHEEDFEMLVEQVRRGIESAETIAFAENSDINSLEKARQILDSHEPTLSILADIADEKAKSGDINYVDSVSSLTEQFNSVKYGIEDRLDQSGLEEAGDVYPKLSEVLVSQLLEGEDAPSAERVPQRPEESEGVEEQLKNMSNQGKTPKLVAKLAAIGDVPADLLPKKDDLSHRIDDVNKKLDDQVNDLKRFEEKTIELQNVIDECRDKLKSRDTAEPIEIVQKDAEDLAVVLATIDAIPQEELSPRNQLARDTNNIKEQAKEQLSTLRKALTDEEKAREKQDELKNRLSAIGDSLNKVDPENVDYAQQLVSSLEPELQKLGDIADICHQFAISSSPVVSHNDLDKTLPDQVRDLQKKCDDVKKKTEQVAQLNAVAPEILLISESLQQQPEEIPSNLNEQQAVLEDLETKKQRLENLLQTIPTGDATEELRQKSAWDLSKLKDLLKRLGDSVGDKLAALAAFNAARKDAEDQLLAITGPVSEEKTPDELKKDEESLVRLQQNISQLDRDGLDEEQRDEHAQLLDRINKSLDIIKVCF
ncbi:hypothetical protein NECAME_01728 [Necator americanus]|uniref:Nuclear anchorage protein 1 spectrin repeat domain-containing protein n=1 Tax=Necator americanus TaxID=51031 RepID=W2TPC5_NECAM|nr:hypothetical protein NECAME_01728 [Necator americanus]ETN83935.1 hypothetical protein NECAME_01728 [Necator americanus]